jgi:CMP/dCMP kinase
MKVAIDGPAASGKSTVAKIIADKLDFMYIDSGAMYRAVTLTWLAKTNADKSNADEEILADIIAEIKIEFTGNGKALLINGKDQSKEIRSSLVSQNVSYVASFEVVRTALVEKQRELSKGNNVIMDGRDIGTVVFPDAEVKIFLDASAETRALRRIEDLKKLGEESNLQVLIEEIKQRDELDSKREIAPLIKAKDAIEIITDNKSINDVSQAIMLEIEKFTAV